jgi:hypothetical protein
LLLRLKDGYQQQLHLTDKCFICSVVGIIPKVTVEISDEVDQTLLLSAGDGIVAPIEIGNQHALIVRQKLMDNSRLSRLSHSEDDVLSVGEHPDIMICPLDVDECLVIVDKRTLQDTLHRQCLGCSIVLGKVSDEVDQCALTRSLIKEVLHLLSDDAIRKAKDYSLIDHPSLKGMPKELIPEFFNLRRRIMLSALLTVALRAEIFAYSLSTSAFREA